MAKVLCSQCGAYITDDERYGDTMLYSTCQTCAEKAKERKKNPQLPRPPPKKKEYIQ